MKQAVTFDFLADVTAKVKAEIEKRGLKNVDELITVLEAENGYRDSPREFRKEA